jgi:hypothetical protein
VTAVTAPRWTRIVLTAAGLAALALSWFSFFAPEVLFGADAYHLSTRVATGLLGATTAGLGATALLVSIDADVPAVRATILAFFIASALVPPVIVYNIGAFNQTDPTGWRAAIVAGGAILLISLPLMLALLAINRVHRATRPARRRPSVSPAIPGRAAGS